jgi:hypothetical protein
MFHLTVPLTVCLISKIKPGCAQFTKASLARELADELKWLIDNADESPFRNDLICRDLSQIAIKNIIYDKVYGLFKVGLINT